MWRRLLARWIARPAPVPLRLYTKPGCHLCDEMKREIARARCTVPVELVEVNIERDPELAERHGRSIPVLEIAGRVAFKGRLEAAELEKKLARRLSELRSEASAGARESRHG